MNPNAAKAVMTVLFVAAALTPRWAPAAERPNIIIFLADDLGYADVGIHGCKDIHTPHIDAIANNGVRFTDGYANHPVCSPSRAGLMTGMYQHRFGFENNSGPEAYAAPNFGVPRNVPMLSEKLKAVGYATGMVGKWHIGFKEGLRPQERGFDFFYGFLSGARSYYWDGRQQNTMYRNRDVLEFEAEYLTDAFAREAEGFIDRSEGGPFFLYVAFNAVHAPMEATEEYESRFPTITDPKRKTYAGMLSAMDDAIGRVMAKVREHGLEENTLVAFYSDNGGPTPQTTSRNDPLRGFKAQMYEGGVRVPFAMQWKGIIAPGGVYREMVMGFDVHATALAAAGLATSGLDGVDLLPYLTGRMSGRPHEMLFWRTGRTYAARVGDWKLVQDRAGDVQLFNLAADIGESTDLATSEPEKRAELEASYAAWSSQMMPPRWIRQDRRNAYEGGKLKPLQQRRAKQNRRSP